MGPSARRATTGPRDPRDGIPEPIVGRANLAYLDPAEMNLDDWKTDPLALVGPDAGEVLYCLA
jgi:hypothetical protein